MEAVALAKAQQAFAQLRAPLVVEDSGFCVDALSSFPGPYTKYVLATIGVAGLLRLAAPLPSRACRFVAALVHADGDGVMHSFLDDRGTGVLALEADDTPCRAVERLHPRGHDEADGRAVPGRARRAVDAVARTFGMCTAGAVARVERTSSPVIAAATAGQFTARTPACRCTRIRAGSRRPRSGTAGRTASPRAGRCTRWRRRG